VTRPAGSVRLQMLAITTEHLKMSISHKSAQAVTFDAVLDQMTLAFEPYPSLASLLLVLDLSAAATLANDAPEAKETPIVPLWEEPLWSESEFSGLAAGRSPACHYTQKSDKPVF